MAAERATALPDVAGARVLVYSLGIEGRDLARWLLARGAAVTMADSRDEARLEAAGALPPEEARPLLESWRLWTRVQALGRLLSEDAGPDDVPEGLRPLFESAARIESFAALDARLQEAAAEVREIFRRRLGTPPAA